MQSKPLIDNHFNPYHLTAFLSHIHLQNRFKNCSWKTEPLPNAMVWKMNKKTIENQAKLIFIAAKTYPCTLNNDKFSNESDIVACTHFNGENVDNKFSLFLV